MEAAEGRRMGEVWRKLEAYSVDMQCPECKKGVMRDARGFDFLAEGPNFKHVCDNCGHIEYYDRLYPRLEYKAVNSGGAKNV